MYRIGYLLFQKLLYEKEEVRHSSYFALPYGERVPPTKDFRKRIPYSITSTWRRLDDTSCEGHLFRFLFEQDWESVCIRNEYFLFKKQLRSLAKTWLLLKREWQTIKKEAGHNPSIKNHIKLSIQYLERSFGLAPTLKIFTVSRSQYLAWTQISQYRCTESLHELCLRSYPNQLRSEEIKNMKKLLSSPICERWPVSSIAAFGLRKNKVAVSLYSWYKYAKAMGLQHPVMKASHKVTGLRASKPNEYLHIDTTYLLLADGAKTCITVVVDNYSRMILGFDVSAALSFEVVKGAIQNALLTIATHPDQEGSFLVADGGRENHNHHIDSFLQSLADYKLKKIRALKDIQFSNSPIEAIHRILKGRYLRKQCYKTMEELRHSLEEAIFDYNERRPHYAHSPRTPKEVYFNLPLGFDPLKRMQRARKKRTNKNRAVACQNCSNRTIRPSNTVL